MLLTTGLSRRPVLLDGLVQVDGGRQGEVVSPRRTPSCHYAGADTHRDKDEETELATDIYKAI